jgi:hypothetical protein
MISLYITIYKYFKNRNNLHGMRKYACSRRLTERNILGASVFVELRV